jgi:hypothetical protein
MEASASLKTLSARVILDYWRPLKHPFFKHVIDVYDRIDGDLSQMMRIFYLSWGR